MKTGKRARAASIIGGADGPTAIFMVGHKEKNIFRRIRLFLLNYKYKRKRAHAVKSVIASSHTIEEVIQYIASRYGAVESDTHYPYYQERKRSMRYSLIQRYKPELLGPQKSIMPPRDFNDEESLKLWQAQIEEWHQECQRRVNAISQEVFPTDYRLFLIHVEEKGTLEIEMDTLCPAISISYSGDKKLMETISKDIYLYFGVSQTDIDNKSPRYQALLIALSA